MEGRVGGGGSLVGWGLWGVRGWVGGGEGEILVWESACGSCCGAGLAHVEFTSIVVVMTFLYITVDWREDSIRV